MPNIVLSQIDERLMLNQIRAQWVKFSRANLVIVAIDKMMRPSFQKKLTQMASTCNVTVRFWTLQKTIETIHCAVDKQRIMLICQTPQDFLTLVEGGVTITEINVSDMPHRKGKNKIHKTVSIDEQDKAAFIALKKHGVESFIQPLPSEPAVNVYQLL